MLQLAGVEAYVLQTDLPGLPAWRCVLALMTLPWAYIGGRRGVAIGVSFPTLQHPGSQVFRELGAPVPTGMGE